MDINFAGLIPYVIIATFTPGPNNITSMSMGVLHGYKVTLRYIAGIVSGFVISMLVCGLLATFLNNAFPATEPFLRIAGALYILWLAYETLKTTYNEDVQTVAPMGYWRGIVLQLVNAKVFIYGLTLYTGFLLNVVQYPLWFIISAFALASVSFASTSTWALFGSAIRTYLHKPVIRRVVNIVLSMALIYTAIEMSQIIPFVQGMYR